MTTFGIDLGTTYSCIAYVDDTGRPVVAKNAIGDDVTPSVVFFETANNVVVGRDAKNSAMLSPDTVVSLIKRKMGQPDVELEFHGMRHTPETISALILKELARSAAEHTRRDVREVVVTVPAYFGVSEREATRNAGAIAGLEVLNLVPEPVAAALHYDAVSAGAQRTILVYDLGGGTFDTTVIRLEGNAITVVCTDGDHRLGGADWDERIADHLMQQFMDEHPGSEALDSEDFLQELAGAAEELKRALSSVDTRRHNMRFGGEVTRVELSRAEFERLTSDLLERTFDITRRTVAAAAEKGFTQFDDVLLVGGATRMPAVAAGLRERFGFEPKLHDPDLAVAKGAALFALIESVKVALPDGAGAAADPRHNERAKAMTAVADQLGIAVEQVRSLAEKQVTIVVPRAFGVKVYHPEDPDADAHGFVIDHLLVANTPLPASPPTQQYVTIDDGQTAVKVEIWEQAGATRSPRIADNAQIGEGLITDLPRLPKGSPIDITFQMDASGTVRVRAVELVTGKELTMELKIEGLSGDEVTKARHALARYTVGA